MGHVQKLIEDRFHLFQQLQPLLALSSPPRVPHAYNVGLYVSSVSVPLTAHLGLLVLVIGEVVEPVPIGLSIGTLAIGSECIREFSTILAKL